MSHHRKKHHKIPITGPQDASEQPQQNAAQDPDPEGGKTPPDTGQHTDCAAEIAALNDYINELQQQVQEHKENTLRAAADLQNFRRRSIEENARQMQYANENLIAELLPVMDNFERALECEVDESARGLQQGVCMILGQLMDVLSGFGVQKIASVGQFFDPALHEAVERVETDDPCEGTIVEEVLPGYMLHDRLLRPAKVKVAVTPH